MQKQSSGYPDDPGEPNSPLGSFYRNDRSWGLAPYGNCDFSIDRHPPTAPFGVVIAQSFRQAFSPTSLPSIGHIVQVL
jgi:hypothetical protein